MAHKSYKLVQKQRQTEKERNKNTTYNTLNILNLPNVKYMFDKLIIVNVYTTAKSNLCIMYHSIKGSQCDKPNLLAGCF